MNLPPLEPTDDKASPAFHDKALCLAWLSQLQLTNLHQAHTTLRTQLDELNRFPMRGNERLQTLEALRETVAVIQSDYAKKLVSKKLPLSNDELVTFLALIGLWQGMSAGYQRCLQDWEAGDKQLAAQAALLVHRCLRYAVLQAYEYLRIGYELDAKPWLQLHALYAYAEAHELQTQMVADDRYSRDHPNSARTLYGSALLASHVANIGLTRAQWQMLDRWLNAWGDETLTVERRCSMSIGDASPLAVDMAGTQGLQALTLVTAAESLRYMVMVPLSKFMRVKTILLQQGKTPAQLGLGSDLTSAEAVDLLNLLHKHWCEEPSPKPLDNTLIQVCYGLEEIYAQVGNKPFKPISKSLTNDKAAIQQIEAFGRVLSDTNRHNLVKLGFVLEEWQPENAISLLGARLLRKNSKGERIGLNQLVGVRSQSKDGFNVGVVKSVLVDRGGRLHIGVHFQPGIAQAIVLRGGSINEPSPSAAAAGLLMQEMPNLHIPASLLIPREWFQTNRSIEITHADNRKQTVVLGFSVEKGADYERVSFKLA